MKGGVGLDVVSSPRKVGSVNDGGSLRRESIALDGTTPDAATTYAGQDFGGRVADDAGEPGRSPLARVPLTTVALADGAELLPATHFPRVSGVPLTTVANSARGR